MKQVTLLRSRALLWFFSLFLTFSIVQATYAEPMPSGNEEKPLTLGFFPIISTVALYKRFSPLRDYLSETLGRKVVLVTAKDFPTFYERTAQGKYDIVVTAPHFAVSAADSGKYVIRATLIKDVQQLIVVKDSSPVTAIKQLGGKVIATPPEDALMTMMGKRFLADAGLTGTSQPSYRAFNSHNAANQALLGDEVDAAIASSNIIAKAIKRGEPLRILDRGLKLPNMATMVAKNLDAEIGDQIVQILIAMTSSEKGKDVLQRIDFPGYRAVSAQDYELARPYMEQLQKTAND